MQHGAPLIRYAYSRWGRGLNPATWQLVITVRCYPRHAVNVATDCLIVVSLLAILKTRTLDSLQICAIGEVLYAYNPFSEC